MSARPRSMPPGSPRLPWFTGLAVAMAVGLWLGLGPVPESLVFDRLAIAHGEWWRLATGHWVHCDGQHALWDIAALALVGSLVEGGGRRRMLLAAAVGIAAVDAAIWWCLPALERYCGLSGVLNTLFVLALADLWRRSRSPVVPLAALLLGGKLTAEIALGQSVLLDSLWPAVPGAHVAGCLAGLAVLGLERSILLEFKGTICHRDVAVLLERGC